jgi:hypothetical protein
MVGIAALSCGGEAENQPVAAPKPPLAPQPLPPPPQATSAAPHPALALSGDEGMWLLNDFPAERLAKLHGFSPTKEWLDHVRLSSVRLALGCSGSIVSPEGLVMTNHHCASGCIQHLSTKEHDLAASGYLATNEKEERKCPGMEINQLVDISDVTERMTNATKGLTGRPYFDALKAATATVEKECSGGKDEVRCDVVSLYRGGRYHLYRYRRFQDVRLVFAPEAGVASFGGDPDNFNFPRYDLDLSLVRIYENDKPAKLEHYFKWSQAGAKDGDLTFVSGHPGRTSRLLTMAQLEFRRDIELPIRLIWLSELRGVLLQYADIGKEEQRTSAGLLHRVENAIKALKGRREALVDEPFMARKREDERALRTFVDATPALADVKGSWDALEHAQADARRLYRRYALLEGNGAFNDDLSEHAMTLVRAATELKKPNAERLPEFADAKLPALKAELFANTPIYPRLETVLLTHALTKLREGLTVDDPLVKKILGKRSPAEFAASAVKGTRLADPAVRKAIFEGRAAANTMADPMLALARLIDDEARAVRKEMEDKVDAVAKRNGELIAKARFALYGTSQYPDATFSLRLSYGVVKGFREGDRDVKPFTDFGGLFDRATGSDPFRLPPRWIAAEKKIDRGIPFNFATTNDIIGGNSGSPVINKEAELVGLIFDGNIHSLGGDFGYDGDKGRAVAVHSAGIIEALDKVYGAKRILAELGRR